MGEEYYPDREDNFYRKSDLIRQMEALANHSYSSFKEWLDTRDEAREIIDDWKSTGSVNCREARRYYDNPGESMGAEFKSALDSYFSEGDRLRQERDDDFSDREARKETLISEAQSLLSVDNPFEAQKQYRELMDEWKTVGFCGDSDSMLWDSFRDVGDKLRQRSDARANEFSQALARKKTIVENLRQALSDAPPGARMSLVWHAEADWREAGSGGKNESQLWSEFQSIIRPIKDSAREHAARFAERANQKRALIEEARRLLQSAERNRWKMYLDILARWKEVGSAGRAENELWNELKAISEKLRPPRQT